MALAAQATALSGQGRGAGNRDSAGVRIVESGAPLWTARAAWHLNATPSLTLGSANGETATQFGSIVGAVRLGDGSIVVADSKNAELRRFSAAGKFIRKIGQRGEGPGDFAGLWSLMRQPGDTIVTWDIRSHRLTWFLPDGKVARTLAVDQPAKVSTPDGHTMGARLVAIGMFGDGTLLAKYRNGRFNPKPGLYSDSLHLVHGSSLGKITPVTTLFEGESYSFETADHSELSDDRPFTTKASFAAAANSLFYTDGVRNEVREYDLGGRLLRIIRLRKPLQPVTSADVAAFRDRDLAETRSGKFRNEADRQPAINREKELLAWLPFPRTLPAFTALKIDPAGNLLVREYGDSTHAERWDVFDKGGRLLGTIEMPAALDVLEIGTDYVLGLMKDEDDVESVRLYRLLH